MSGLRGDDDGGRKSPDPDGLPGFPAEWGRIVIPDDCAELEREATKVRRELRRETLLRRYGLQPKSRGHLRHLALPLALVVLAVLVTTTSLVAAMWPQTNRTTGTAGRGSSGSPSSAPVRALSTGAPLPDLTLTASSGRSLRLRSTYPAVILVTRNCGCSALITDTARAAAKSNVTVLVVGSKNQPALPSLPGNARVVAATDPSGQLAEALAVGASPTPSNADGGAILVNAKGNLVRTVPDTDSADTFSTAIPSLS